MPIDEFYYTIPAFNLYHYGEVNHDVVPFIKDQNTPWNVLQNWITYHTLSFFGNNYYGLRMAAVLSAISILMLMFLILRKLLYADSNRGEKSERGKPFYGPEHETLMFLVLYLLCDFSLMIAGRVAEPTIFRMLALVMTIYAGIIVSESTSYDRKWIAFLLGFLSLAAVLYVYIYNAFIFIGFAATVYIWSSPKGWRNALQNLTSFVMGSVLCLLTFTVYIQTVYHSNLGELFSYMVPFQNRMGAGLDWQQSLIAHCVNFIFIFLTNIFRFNLSLLFVFIISVPIFINRLRKYWDRFDILIANLLVFLILQSIIINDFPSRKLVILLPLVIIIIARSFQHSPEYFDFVEATDGKHRQVEYYWILAVTAVLCVAGVYLNPGLSDSFGRATGNFMYANMAVFLFVAVVLFLKCLRSYPISRYLIILGMILVLIPNTYLDGRYIFFHRDYYFRNTMIALGNDINGKIVVGGCSYGFRLYNESIPVLDSYIYSHNSKNKQEQELFNQKFDRMFTEGNGYCSIAYSAELPNDPFGAEYMCKHGLSLEKEFALSDGGDLAIGIYRPGN